MGVKWEGRVVFPASPKLTHECSWTRETPWALVAAGPSFAGKGNVENVCGKGQLEPVNKWLRETWGLVTGLPGPGSLQGQPNALLQLWSQWGPGSS